MRDSFMGPDPATAKFQQSDPVVAGIQKLLQENSSKRIVVVGTTCTGKSTMLAQISGARDQDEELFPKLTRQETDYVSQSPWTEEIGRTMIRLVRERVRSEIGRPLFGTVVVSADLIVLLTISDALLRGRVKGRGVKFQDAKNMQTQLEEEVRASGIAWIAYSVG